MIGVLATLAGAFGAIIGSFLNVVIHRLPRKEPFGMARSKCPRCGTQIAWHDNIPLVSYLLLVGRCRSCRARISLRYPLVEALTAAVFVLCVFRVEALGYRPPLAAWGFCAAFSAVLIAASFIDWDHKLLPDALTMKAGPLIAIAGAVGVPEIPGTDLFGYELALAMKPGAAALLVGLAGALVGGGVILIIRLVGGWLLKKEAMGLGDVKFMAMCGLLLGAEGALMAICVGLVAGAILGILIWLVSREREIPFGPFLAIGALGVLLFRPEIQRFVFETYPGWFH